MIQFKIVAFCAVLALATSQNYDYDDQNVRTAPARLGSPSAPKPTPVAILKQINRHNEDGSYTYGYEGGDGSFKIETKLPTGEVKGKYGYVDDTGKVRVVEYGATKYGFEPSGEGITVAPPTLVDETTNRDGSTKPEYTAEFYDPQPAPAPRPAPRPKARPAFDSYSPPQQFEPAPQRAPANFEYSPPKARPAPLRPAPSSFSFDDDQSFQQQSPRPLPKISYAQPAPARPATKFSFDDDFGSQKPQQSTQFSFDEPRFAPQARPAPQQQFANAAPSPRQQFAAPAPRPAPRPAPAVRSSGGGGILDQLAKDYALPNGGSAALHDISFGYY